MIIGKTWTLEKDKYAKPDLVILIRDREVAYVEGTSSNGSIKLDPHKKHTIQLLIDSEG